MKQQLANLRGAGKTWCWGASKIIDVSFKIPPSIPGRWLPSGDASIWRGGPRVGSHRTCSSVARASARGPRRRAPSARVALVWPLRCLCARAPRVAPESRQHLVQEQGRRIPRVALQLARRGPREASEPAEVWKHGKEEPAESGSPRMQSLLQTGHL